VGHALHLIRLFHRTICCTFLADIVILIAHNLTLPVHSDQRYINADSAMISEGLDVLGRAARDVAIERSTSYTVYEACAELARRAQIAVTQFNMMRQAQGETSAFANPFSSMSCADVQCRSPQEDDLARTAAHTTLALMEAFSEASVKPRAMRMVWKDFIESSTEGLKLEK